MRKTRLVILPTKCLHQMGFLLLFLSCPVIGDWGRIRPESETLHNAIRVDREGTCGLQREPPGGFVRLLEDNGSKQCRLGDEFMTNSNTKKPIHREIRSDERRVDLERNTQQRHIREIRQNGDERKNIMKAIERRDNRRESSRRLTEERRIRTTNERRRNNERQDMRRETRREVRENQIRSRSVDPRRSLRQQETSIRRQRLATMRNTQSDNEMERTRMGERRMERRSFREDYERRENERRIREDTKERRIRSENRREVQERSSRRREDNRRVRESRERSVERQMERLSLARRELNREIRSENGRNNERMERIRKSRSFDNIRDAGERRYGEKDTRRNAENRRLVNHPLKETERDVRERRFAPLSDRIDRNVDIKARRITSANVRQNLEDRALEGKIEEEPKMAEKITKWMDLKKYESLKVGDWTTNCVVGAVVYFLSTRQIKTV